MRNEPSSENRINSDIIRNIHTVRESGLLDYRSAALPTWCPGCGYYGITHAVLQALKDLTVSRENFAVISGIGCAGRYPFFMQAYGLHGIHGRALPLACGVKMARPELTVLAVGGDGDGFGIGGGHLPHAIRRNVDITYIVFDNSIYGLTKGQVSPTTPHGQITKTSPYGNPEHPLKPLVLGLAYGASFVASGFAGLPDQLTPILIAAFQHSGFSLVVITTPCITFDHVNITYPRMRDAWQPLPNTHNPADRSAALALALDVNYYSGVLFQETRPTWDEEQQRIARKACQT